MFKEDDLTKVVLVMVLVELVALLPCSLGKLLVVFPMPSPSLPILFTTIASSA
jgi:hypothetical protein